MREKGREGERERERQRQRQRDRESRQTDTDRETESITHTVLLCKTTRAASVVASYLYEGECITTESYTEHLSSFSRGVVPV